MACETATARFTERYAQLRASGDCVREKPSTLTEHVLQCVWYDQLFSTDTFKTLQGHHLKVLSPGWWNHAEGPDFKGAQLEFNGALHNGDVEIHLDRQGWRAHGHHLDARYNEVILHVFLDGTAASIPAVTSNGRQVAGLQVADCIDPDLDAFAETIATEDYTHIAPQTCGRCTDLIPRRGTQPIEQFIEMAGEWRMLNKARALREQIERVGPDQALHEAFFYACGFGRFKQHFKAVARSLPYERAIQLAQQEPMLLEAALLQISALMPERLPKGTTAVPHYGRLRRLRRDELDGLRSLPLTWHRVGIRPQNNPERRMAGAAAFLQRTAPQGIARTLEELWQDDIPPLARRRKLEALFAAPVGFWATHCTWTGKKMTRPTAPIGPGRARSIIGNVFVPAALALARQQRNRTLEETVYEFFAALPKEPDNTITKAMIPRLLPGKHNLKMTFQKQQGLLQMHQDWCQPNPSCRNCSVLKHLEGFTASG